MTKPQAFHHPRYVKRPTRRRRKRYAVSFKMFNRASEQLDSLAQYHNLTRVGVLEMLIAREYRRAMVEDKRNGTTHLKDSHTSQMSSNEEDE